ncbi:hypothetical protein STANM337S_07440 [Streptomyces tanashiensis]
MSAAEATGNIAALHRFHSATNSGDPGLVARAIDELAAPDMVFHAPVPLGATGAEALKRVWETLLRAFPDLHVTVEETVAEGDRVVSRNTVTGTHRGEYRWRPARAPRPRTPGPAQKWLKSLVPQASRRQGRRSHRPMARGFRGTRT